MKLTNTQLRQIIKEELSKVMDEGLYDSIEGQSVEMGRKTDDAQAAMQAVDSVSEHSGIQKIAAAVEQGISVDQLSEMMRGVASELSKGTDLPGVNALYRFFSKGPFGSSGPGGNYDPLAIGVQLVLKAVDRQTRSGYSGDGRMDDSVLQKLELAANRIVANNKRPSF